MFVEHPDGFLAVRRPLPAAGFGSLVPPTAPLAQDALFELGIADAFDPSMIDRSRLEFRFNRGAGFTEWGFPPNVTCMARGEPGRYGVAAAVRDKDGASVSYSRQVTVENAAPVVVIDMSIPITVARGTPLNFDAHFVDRVRDAFNATGAASVVVTVQ